jgi:carboxypeptidase Q
VQRLRKACGPNVAATVGAAAVLVRSVGGADYRLPHTGATVPSPDGHPLPAAAAEDADLLANLSRQGPVRMQLTRTPQTLPRVEAIT